MKTRQLDLLSVESIYLVVLVKLKVTEPWPQVFLETQEHCTCAQTHTQTPHIYIFLYGIWSRQDRVLRRHWLLYSCVCVWRVILPCKSATYTQCLSLSHSPIDYSWCSGKKKSLLHSCSPSVHTFVHFQQIHEVYVFSQLFIQSHFLESISGVHIISCFYCSSSTRNICRYVYVCICISVYVCMYVFRYIVVCGIQHWGILDYKQKDITAFCP